jgi:uncharacterized protein YjbI with pentapeptide repeats
MSSCPSPTEDRTVRRPFDTETRAARKAQEEVAMKSRAVFERVLTTREKTELRGGVFRDCEWVGLDLSAADLRDAIFERVVLVDCTLAGADLRGAHFVLCDLRCVVLDDARLGDNRFDGTILVEVAGLTTDDRRLVERQGGAFQHARASPR